MTVLLTNEKKHHFHAFAIYDPNNLDKNKDSPDIPNLLWVVYLTSVKKTHECQCMKLICCIIYLRHVFCVVIWGVQKLRSEKSSLAFSLKSIEKLTRGQNLFFLVLIF